MKTFSIIIPIYNESESIFDLIEEIHSEFKKNIPELIIVDDGRKMISINKDIN